MMKFQPRWLAMLAVSFTMLTAGAAAADQRAEGFVEQNANTALQILNDDGLSIDDKKAQFRSLVEEVADVPRITRFVLGRYARGIDEADMADFSDVFSQYAIGVYESRLGEYGGETLTVTGSTDRQPGDAIVHTEVSGGDQAEPLSINWRVLTSDAGVPKVVDVEVYGVWLAINQRDEMTAIINNNRGRVSAATEALRRKLDERDFAGG